MYMHPIMGLSAQASCKANMTNCASLNAAWHFVYGLHRIVRLTGEMNCWPCAVAVQLPVALAAELPTIVCVGVLRRLGSFASLLQCLLVLLFAQTIHSSKSKRSILAGRGMVHTATLQHVSLQHR